MLQRIAALGVGGWGLISCSRSKGLFDAPVNAAQLTQERYLPSGCILTPQQTEGPFFFDPRRQRRDIAPDRPGVPLRIRLRIVDAGTCAPVVGAIVDVWHADAAGLYSGFGEASLDPVSGVRPDFMRGTLPTDESGRVVFESKWPGWYPNRTVHVHIKVLLPGIGGLATTQLYLPDELNDRVLSQHPYSARGERQRRNTNDPVLALRDLATLQMTVTPTAAGYAAWHTLGVRL